MAITLWYGGLNYRLSASTLCGWFESLLFHFWFSLLLMCLEKQWKISKAWVPVRRRETWMQFWAPGFRLSQPFEEWTPGWKSFLSISSCNSTFQSTNQNPSWMICQSDLIAPKRPKRLVTLRLPFSQSNNVQFLHGNCFTGSWHHRSYLVLDLPCTRQQPCTVYEITPYFSFPLWTHNP